MSTRSTVFTTIFLIAFALAFSFSVFDRLPDQMASHWNTANQVDGYMSRFWGAFLMPIVSVGMLALFLVIPNIDPLKANIRSSETTSTRSSRSWLLFWFTCTS